MARQNPYDENGNLVFRDLIKVRCQREEEDYTTKHCLYWDVNDNDKSYSSSLVKDICTHPLREGEINCRYGNTEVIVPNDCPIKAGKSIDREVVQVPVGEQ